eukprot:403369566
MEVSEASEIFNFSPGPACLPKEVLKQVQDEFMSYKGYGFSIVEMASRTPEYYDMIEEANKGLRDLLNIPENYLLLWCQGGAYQQFTAVPFNLGQSQEASYLVSGFWSEESAKEASKFLGNVHQAWTPTEEQKFVSLPQQEDISVSKDSKYLYYCDNETIHGVEFAQPIRKDERQVPIVCDFTSNFASRRIDWDNMDVAFAGVQKNLGPSGLCSVIINQDLIGNKRKDTPILCDWELHKNSPNNFYNTPNVFALYLTNLVIQHTKRLGVDYYDDLAKQRSSLIYDLIDNSNGFYTSKVDPKSRSRMNVSFHLKSKEEDQRFAKLAKEEGLLWLAGHAKFGGCRASMYNAMPIEGAIKLQQFMKKFQDETERL